MASAVFDHYYLIVMKLFTILRLLSPFPSEQLSRVGTRKTEHSQVILDLQCWYIIFACHTIYVGWCGFYFANFRT